MKQLFLLTLSLALAGLCFAQTPETLQGKPPRDPDGLAIFRQAYPDVMFNAIYDRDKADWKIELIIPEGDTQRIEVLYWSNGSMLPESELGNKEKYWTLLYNYNYGQPLEDPADFTQEQIDRMKNFSSTENRRNGAGTPMFFFDALYQSHTKESLEKHVQRITFLGKPLRVHQRLKEPLQRVEQKINEAATTDPSIKPFIAEINQLDAYYWRLIAGTNRKSFHSLGIAVDILPKNLKGKAIYWSWTKDVNPDWMLTPLADRWMPPQSVIDIFEDEGFIWGGKWGIWDNMHFEYHPELILEAKRKKGLFQN
ncbi:MAG: M15 family metallopeptidase [Treponema sp.]|nr:M15 family metallopeptidase [Treponema sp.]